MPNYKEQTGLGTSWVRASRVIADNTDGKRMMRFDEETVFLSPDGARHVAPSGGVTAYLTTENHDTVFPLLDNDGNPTGQTSTYADVYLLLMSLYYHVATLRDDAEALGNV